MHNSDGSKESSLQKYLTDVRRYRLAGLGLYHGLMGWGIITVLGGFEWQEKGGFIIFLGSVLLTLIQWIPASIMTVSLVSVEPVPFLLDSYTRYLPKWLVKGKTRVEFVLGRLFDDRTGSKAWLILTVHAICGSIFLILFSACKGHSASSSFRFGAVLGITLAFQILGSGGDILKFPSIHRHRFLVLKGRLLPALWKTIQVEFWAILIELLISTYKRKISLWVIAQNLPISGSLIYTLCSFIGLEILKVIFSEPLKFQSESFGTESLLDLALNNTQDPVTQTAAFQRLELISKSQGATGNIRKGIFSDDSGKRWQIVANACLNQVNEATRILVNGLPQSVPENNTTNHEWNKLPTGSKQSLSVSDRSSDISAWKIRARFQNISFSLKALTGFCIASKSEDQYGILQLTEPGLASVLASILSLDLAISSYLDTLKKKHGSSHSGAVESIFALERLKDLLLHSLVAAFGEDLLPILSGFRTKPEYGSPAELISLMQAFLKGKKENQTVHDLISRNLKRPQYMNGV